MLGGPASSVTLGWPSDQASAVSLSAGTSYRLSYQVSTTAALSGFQAKVGQAVPPYTGVDYTVTDIPTTAPTVFTHTFSVSPADPAAGLAFNFVGGVQAATVCFDNVSLVAN
jgi:hypothetical protein